VWVHPPTTNPHPFQLDDWATTEAAPSDNEIGKLKELIRRVGTHLDQLTIGERADIVTAITAVRRTRQITSLGIPGISSRSKDREPADLRLERP
jgi:hypothetical protein